MTVKIYYDNTSMQYSNVTQVVLNKNGAMQLLRPFNNPDGAQAVTIDPSTNRIEIVREGNEE